MSLKVFHMLFIAASIILAWIFAGWLFGSYKETHRGLYLAAAAASVAASFLLMLYERWFYSKSKRLDKNA